MAKRRRKKPNISRAVLDQARQGASPGADDPSAPEQAAAIAPTSTKAVEQRASSDSSASRLRRRRRELGTAKLERRKEEGTLDGETVAELLANPTKVVSEEQLRAEYGFVIKDLRHMGILAAALFAALVAVSLVLL